MAPTLDSKFTILHTKEFTNDQKSIFEDMLNKELQREAAAAYRKPELKWLALMNENGDMVSGLVYKIYKKKKIVYLKSLVTDINHRCHGHASRLLAYLEEKVAGSRQILFYCDPCRVPFYKKRGAQNFKKRKFNKLLRDIKGMPAECLTMEFPKTNPGEMKGKQQEKEVGAAGA